MLKSEAEDAIRRLAEETGAQFTEEQVQTLARAITKICERMIEEALSQWRPSNSNR